MKKETEEKYKAWRIHAVADPDLIPELEGMTETEIEDAFYRDLAFGTGGLRGTIGAGTNRLNVYTVAKATQGLANYLKTAAAQQKGLAEDAGEHKLSAGTASVSTRPSVVIGYDSRIKSDLFAKTTAIVMAENGIEVHLWPRLLPVPTVSFATRYLHASAGVMITASHNPSKYNGYKVYGPDGCQITTEAAAAILKEIEAVDVFDVKMPATDDAAVAAAVSYIPDSVLDAFIANVKAQSVLGSGNAGRAGTSNSGGGDAGESAACALGNSAAGAKIDRNVAIVYSPLNGTGREPVTRVLRETGFTNITMVKEQEMPDGHFPTCPYPNPEIREAMELGLQYSRKVGADLMLATDPDCDRCGIAVRNKEGEYQLLTGNETGLLLLDFICSRRIANGTMPAHPVMIKTIVTSDMGEQIAEHYGVKTINVLTGFKFIGEQIGRLEAEGRAEDYIFGFEESYGYLTGSYVRDKDAVDAAFMICEMFAYYKTHGISLLDRLDELYRTYGYRLNTLHSYEFDGEAGFHKMQEIMKKFHAGVTAFGGKKVEKTLDYSQGLDGLPKSDVLKYLLEGSSSVVVRPSGTEPKLKVYISISDSSMDAAAAVEKTIAAQLESYMK